MSKENRVSDELLPCPFCGGTAKLSNYRVAEDAMGCHVACTKCLVQTDVFEDAYTPFEQAIRAWNTRSKPVAGVEVKPLEWIKDTRWRFEADSLLGRYTAYCPDDKKGFWRLSLGSHHNLIANFDSLEEAKAAAKADYRNRIMSALLPKATAPVVSEPVAWRDVAAERQRQKDVEGWTEAHDNQHDRGELAKAGACYALISAGANKEIEIDGSGSYRVPAHHWPWDPDWWKPSDRRRNLVKAGALILAEIERLDRAALTAALKEA